MKEIENILKETLQQVIEFRNDYVSNEQAVRTQLIEPILNILGWKTSNPKFVRPNAPDEDGKIPDYTLLKDGKTTLIVEAKNLSVDLQNKNIIDQLANYCFKSGIDFGVLTNGVKWLLFKTFEKIPRDRIVWQVDLEKDKIDYVARSLSSFAYSNIDTLDSLLKKSKILDNNWKLLIGSTDSIVTIISQKLLEKIKSTEPTFKIDPNDLKTFTKGKLTELYELSEIEEEEKDEEIQSIEKKNEFEEVEDVIFKRHQKNKIREKISVTFPDNTLIKHNKVVETFVETIKRIGPEKILPLNLYRSGVAIVSENKDDFYNQHRIGKYWIMVHTSTKEKIAILIEINEKLNLGLVIETFTNEK
ncbi:MAG: type I restriction endonuclease [Candidatus Marinimicrobia bacterium]|jgi:predicted type IV restriction endonuclease|nr:type I restriction endonuclease [Candidatus Neomarinimicrobiota bacterium]MCK9560897.1 type I restriction endonuclease [Candidatus Neomarinimicrobiota bacterium]